MTPGEKTALPNSRMQPVAPRPRLIRNDAPMVTQHCRHSGRVLHSSGMRPDTGSPGGVPVGEEDLLSQEVGGRKEVPS